MAICRVLSSSSQKNRSAKNIMALLEHFQMDISEQTQFSANLAVPNWHDLSLSYQERSIGNPDRLVVSLLREDSGSGEIDSQVCLEIKSTGELSLFQTTVPGLFGPEVGVDKGFAEDISARIFSFGKSASIEILGNQITESVPPVKGPEVWELSIAEWTQRTKATGLTPEDWDYLHFGVNAWRQGLLDDLGSAIDIAALDGLPVTHHDVILKAAIEFRPVSGDLLSLYGLSHSKVKQFQKAYQTPIADLREIVSPTPAAQQILPATDLDYIPHASTFEELLETEEHWQTQLAMASSRYNRYATDSKGSLIDLVRIEQNTDLAVLDIFKQELSFAEADVARCKATLYTTRSRINQAALDAQSAGDILPTSVLNLQCKWAQQVVKGLHQDAEVVTAELENHLREDQIEAISQGDGQSLLDAWMGPQNADSAEVAIQEFYRAAQASADQSATTYRILRSGDFSQLPDSELVKFTSKHVSPISKVAEEILTDFANRLGYARGTLLAAEEALALAKWAVPQEEVATPAPEVQESPEGEQTAKVVGVLPAKEQPRRAEQNIARLLHDLGINESIFQGEDFYIRVENKPYLDLSIERHSFDQHHELYFTHYIDINGDRVHDGEMVFTCDDSGILEFKESAVQSFNGELRGPDRAFANIFSKNLKEQGFGKGLIVDPRAERIQQPETTPLFTLEKTVHSKTGSDLWVVKPIERVDRDDFNQLKNRAKNTAGWYSRYTKGFTFDSEVNANEFIAGAQAHLTPSALKDPSNSEKSFYLDLFVDRLVKTQELISVSNLEISHYIDVYAPITKTLRETLAKEAEAVGLKPQAIMDALIDFPPSIDRVKDEQAGMLAAQTFEAPVAPQDDVQPLRPISQTELKEIHVDYVAQIMSDKDLRVAVLEGHDDFDQILKNTTERVLSKLVEQLTGQGIDPFKLIQNVTDFPLHIEKREPAPKIMAVPKSDGEQESTRFAITDEITRTAGFSPKQRYTENVAAIVLLKKLEGEGRQASPSEKSILAKYNGWGGLANVLQSNGSDYSSRYGKGKIASVPMDDMEPHTGWVKQARDTDLPAILNAEELSSARESINTAFFTPPETTAAIWAGLQDAGLKGGRLFDPSMGVGTFFGTLPEDLAAKSQLYGIEKDSLSGRIAKQIYPEASITVAGFEDVKYPNNYFDAVVTNVPFGNFSIFDKEYPKYKGSIHDFFIYKALEKTKPGGVVAVITSAYTMDKKSAKQRIEYAKQADLLGACRLPSTHQKAQAGVEVSTDILFFRKRDKMRMDGEETPAWVNASLTEELFPSNGYRHEAVILNEQYHHALSDLVIGEPKAAKLNFIGNHQLVSHYEGDNLHQVIADRVEEIMALHAPETFTASIDAEDEAEDTFINRTSLEGEEKYRRIPGSYFVNEKDEITQVDRVFDDPETGKRQATLVKVALPDATMVRLRKMINLRDAYQQLTQLESLEDAESGKGSQIESIRNQLNTQYEGFVKKHGPLNKPSNIRLIIEDPEAGRLRALEVYDQQKGTAEKADIFTKRVMYPAKKIESVDSPLEALYASLNYKGQVDLDYMGKLCGVGVKATEEALVKEKAIFFDPEQSGYVLASLYLSGNVRDKLTAAKAAESMEPGVYAANIEALDAVMPEDLNPDQIASRIGSPWIPPELIKEFVVDLLDIGSYAQYVKVQFNELNGEWDTALGSAGSYGPLATAQYGLERVPFDKLFTRMLNQKSLKVTKKIEGQNGEEKTILDHVATIELQEKAAIVQEKFHKFLWEADSFRTEKLLRVYNDRFNSYLPPKIDGSFLTFLGLTHTFHPRPTQKDGVARTLLGGNTLLAHAVGTGKTFVQIASVMESRRLGLMNKPMWVVPNHLIEQAEREARQLYPNARILALGKDQMTPQKRALFLGRAANNDWDLIITTHSSFGKIPVHPKFSKMIVEGELGRYRAELESTENRLGQKKIEQRIKTLEAKLKSLQYTLENSKDTGVYISDIGVDAFYVDESHNFKNLAVDSGSSSEVAESIGGSQRAWDLYEKTRWLYSKLGSVRNVIFSSATPVSNNVLEIFNVQRYLQPDVLQEMGIHHATSWAGTFLTPRARWEPNPAGTGFKLRTRWDLVNLPEMVQALRLCADVVSKDDAGVDIPDSERVNKTAKMSSLQQAFMFHLDARVKHMQGGGVDPSEDNILKIISEGRQLALDPRLLQKLFPAVPFVDFNESKVNICADTLYKEWADSHEIKGTQLVFCDMGTPHGDDRFSVYSDLKEKLINKGVPAEQIAFIHDAANDAQRSNLFVKVRSGDIRFLVGSTQKMGEGTNVQNRVVALHHLDAPWRPSDIEQRDGRAERQGNMNAEMRRYIYTTEGTFDLFMWSTMDIKAKTFSQVFKGDSNIRELNMEIDPTFAETAAITSNNGLIREKIEIDQDVTRMEILARGQANQIYTLNRREQVYLAENEEAGEKLERLEAFAETIPERNPEDICAWTFDMRPFDIPQTFKGPREEMFKVLNKILKVNPGVTVNGLAYNGVPVILGQHEVESVDMHSHKKVKTIEKEWTITTSQGDLVYQRAADVEKAILNNADQIEAVKNTINYRKKMVLDTAEALNTLTSKDGAPLVELKKRQQELALQIEEEGGKDDGNYGQFLGDNFTAYLEEIIEELKEEQGMASSLELPSEFLTDAPEDDNWDEEDSLVEQESQDDESLAPAM